MFLPIPFLATLCAIAGAVSHSVYWSKHEFDAQVPRIVLGAVLAHFTLTVFLLRESSFLASSLYASALELSYIIALFASITVYRLFRHPLRHFNGPYWARLTTWWKVKHIAKEGPHYALFDKLHRQYGDVVRTGTWLTYKVTALSLNLNQDPTTYPSIASKHCKPSTEALHHVQNLHPT
jgi:hypothetical protein